MANESRFQSVIVRGKPFVFAASYMIV